jgi:CheY-like chemotaxis protein
MASAKVFLIEDDDIIARTTEWRLSRLGYTFCGRASEGRDALAQVQTSDPDLVLIDINLRGEPDGIAVAEHIRAQSAVPFIFLTALSDEETLARAKATGPRGYLVKPFQDHNLRAAIEMALR